MIDNKRFLEVTYAIGTGVNQVFPPAETTEKVNYWLVISNASKTNKVGWAKTASDDPIFNTSGSASINPNTLNFTNGIGWQKPSPGDGNQIMLFSLVHAPEPSTYVLGTIVAGVLALTARNPRFRRIHGRGENEGDSEALANSAEAAQVV